MRAQEQARLLKHDHIGTEHILLGLLDVPDGTAAKVLHQFGYDEETAQADVAAAVRPGTQEPSGHIRELGVAPEAVAAKIDELDPETTADANPEEAAARRMELRLIGDEVHLILRDPTTVAIAKKVTELSDGPIQGVGPVAGMFVPLWRSTNQLLQQIQGVLEPEPEEEDGPTAGKVAKALRTVLAPRLRR